MKSFVARDGSGEPPSRGRNGERDFHGEQRSNETHACTTDPEAKLSKKGKGKEAKLAFTGNVMTENRNGFVVEAQLRQVSGMVERETAKDMIVRYSPGAKRITVGADKAFDTAGFVADMRDFNVTPHVAQNATNRFGHRRSHYRHCGYEISQQKRKRVEEPFGWGKTIRSGSANAAWREEAGNSQVHADNGGLRSYQVAPVDWSNGLSDSRLPNGQCRQRFKLVYNANPEPMPLELHFQQPARGGLPRQSKKAINWKIF